MASRFSWAQNSSGRTKPRSTTTRKASTPSGVGYDGTTWSYARPARKPFADQVGLEAPGDIDVDAINRKFAEQRAGAVGGGSAASPLDTFRPSTETDTGNELFRRLAALRLRQAEENARLGREQAEADFLSEREALRRGAYDEARSFREGLSGTGRGFSPRFVLGGQQDIARARDAGIAAAARRQAKRIADVVAQLRVARQADTEGLSENELGALLEGSGDNLSNVGSGPLSGMFRGR